MDTLDLSKPTTAASTAAGGATQEADWRREVEAAMNEIDPNMKINHVAAELVYDTVNHIVQGICQSAASIRRATASQGGDDTVTPEDIQTFLAVTWPDLLQPVSSSAAAANPPEPLPSQAAVAASRAHRHVQSERYMQAAAAASVSLAVMASGSAAGRGAGSATPGAMKRGRDGGVTPDGRGGATPGSASKRAAR